MIARDYFDKYRERFMTDDKDKLISARDDLYQDFVDELNFIAEIRQLKTHVTVVKLIFEMNRKWNHLRKIFIKELGFTVLGKNYFIKKF